ncbi:MAG: efflux RND transporter periplasmic adaptor subunit [Proteobacteria bacterium]|jgi:RND family efflux transporter MFP subunit|nr:efflux RND transporter periplasmic adaptor subunit [Ramlibacter sp.]MCA0214942.1 efflux RND transporter periplasmic adaptor subunit [Pseudomonadota bacterium]
MKRGLKWVVWAVVVLAVALGVARALSARKAQQQAAVQAQATREQAAVELAEGDVVKAQLREIAQGLPISGSLKAVNSAAVKARVAGELQGLTLREGDAVKAGQVVARVDPTELQSRVRQAQEQADAARAQIDIAQRQWDNNKALVDQGFISRTALDTSANNLAAAQATHKAALAAVDVARKALDDTVLRAPITGVVSLRAAQPGERVGVDARVIEIVDLSRLELEATLSAADSVAVRVGQQATLQIEGNPQPVTARVVRINPSAQAGSRSVLVYLGLDRVDGLRQGLFAQGTLGTARTSAVAVPLGALRTDRPAPYVQVVENGKVVHKPVGAGARGQDAQDAAGETLVAVQGLAAGALVIQGSVGSLREGTAVRFTQPSAARAP